MRIKSYKTTSQVIFFFVTILGFFGFMTGLVYPWFFCYASPGACAGCPLGILEHASIDYAQGIGRGIIFTVYLFGFLGLLYTVFGRGFCGWACPVGFLQDLLDGVRGKLSSVGAVAALFQKSAEFSEQWDETKPFKLKYMKYLVLILIPITSYLTESMLYTDIDPVGAITATIPTLILHPGEYEPGTYFTIKITLTILFFVIVFLLGRAWCRFLCPLGAMMAPFNRFSALQLQFNESNCVRCQQCVKKCIMKIDVPNAPEGEMECIRCGACVDACRFDALKLGFKKLE